MVAPPFQYGTPSKKVVQGSLRFVSEATDLPYPSAGVITLPAGTTWVIVDDVDLGGDRIECGGIVSLVGFGQETCKLRSTGLGAGDSLISSIYTLTLRTIGLYAEAGRQCVEVDGSSWVDPNDRPALDWLLVNFNEGVASGQAGKAAVLTDIGNTINLVVGVFGDGVYFMGEALTAGFDNSIFRPHDGKYGIKMEPGSLITSRLRLTKCAIIPGPAGAIGLDVPVATIDQPEGFILEFCSFDGGGTYIDNITKFDDEARWLENRGIDNTTRLGEMGWDNNATPTPIAASGTYVQAVGVSVAGAFNQRFTHDPAGELTYDSSLRQLFEVTVSANVTGSNNRQFAIRALVDGAPISTRVTKTTLSGTGRAENVYYQVAVELLQGETVTIAVANLTDTTALTITDMSAVVRAV